MKKCATWWRLHPLPAVHTRFIPSSACYMFIPNQFVYSTWQENNKESVTLGTLCWKYHLLTMDIATVPLLRNRWNIFSLTSIFICQQYWRLQVIGRFPAGASSTSSTDSMAKASWCFCLYTTLTSCMSMSWRQLAAGTLWCQWGQAHAVLKDKHARIWSR
jgi:hypothetical protein